jgi:thiamine pyrophosphate-dependent acetolactate synthase large subunit-like protein
MTMKLDEALQILAAYRSGKIVITTMASTAIWPGLSDTPLDFAYIPSAMSQGPSLGLGLALAQPELGVIVVTGDGSLLMNLGCLVTMAAQRVNLYVIVMDNGIYEVTGGQPIAGAGQTDYAGLARAAGIKRVYRFDDVGAWRNTAEAALAGPGPVFISLAIEGRQGQKTPAPPRPMAEQIARLRKALGVGSEGG